ncbi:hypothetical protein GTQ99_07295 [Kineococcus sp. T13]|nr:hypothetical protein [Kineococcus vitellinus]
MILTGDINGLEATRTITFALKAWRMRSTSTRTTRQPSRSPSTIGSRPPRRISTARSGGRSTNTSRRSGTVGAQGTGRDMNAVRAWLRQNDHQVSDRGRIAQELLDAYDAAR